MLNWRGRKRKFEVFFPARVKELGKSTTASVRKAAFRAEC
jgi:hypothetical protein